MGMVLIKKIHPYLSAGKENSSVHEDKEGDFLFNRMPADQTGE